MYIGDERATEDTRAPLRVRTRADAESRGSRLLLLDDGVARLMRRDLVLLGPEVWLGISTCYA
jgi:hypothetical protein